MKGVDPFNSQAQAFSASAFGKAILFGEHAVVHGGTAAAVPLKDIPLRVDVCTKKMSGLDKSIDWGLKVCGEPWQVSFEQKQRLSDAFALAFKLTNQRVPEFLRVRVDSEIPLGGGLGGSAALSSAFLKIAYQIKEQSQDFQVADQLFLKLANELDGFFHGKASGLDVAAVNSHVPIGFAMDKEPWPLSVAFPFKIALVDTGVRTPTSEMVQVVRSRLEAQDPQVLLALRTLKTLSIEGVDILRSGRLKDLGCLLDQCQRQLELLGVSHPENNRIVRELQFIGGSGCKLTGGGGGGMVLGLFEPDQPLPCYVDGRSVLASHIGF